MYERIAPTITRCRSGCAGLDDVLGGGLPVGHFYLIEGEPGTGKTTLALQFMAEGMKRGEKVLCVTLSESRDELLAVAENHGLAVEESAGTRSRPSEQDLKPDGQYTMFYPGEVEFNDRVQAIMAEVERRKPNRLVIDALSEVRMLAKDPLRYRRQVLWLKEYAPENCTVMLLDDRSSRYADLELHSIVHGVVSMDRLALAQESDPASQHLRDARTLVDRSISETRTLSHLLHPPLLDEAGFLSAAKWYVDGFGQRSGITTKLELPSHVHRLPRRTEVALFRILQEALTNVHRHSGSRAVNVSVRTDESVVALTVQDFGMGVPREVLDRFWKTGNVGVGLAGIRERLKELGGTLEIESNLDGTILTATIPASLSGVDTNDGSPTVPSQEIRPSLPADRCQKELLPVLIP